MLCFCLTIFQYNFLLAITPIINSCESVVVNIESDCTADLIISNSAEVNINCAGQILTWDITVTNEANEVVGSFQPTTISEETLEINLGSFEKGSYKVFWQVMDVCDLIASCNQDYTIIDNLAPITSCIDQIATWVIEPSSTVTIWAPDFNLNSFDNCTSSRNLRFSFSEDEYLPSITYNCSDLVGELGRVFSINIWVWDESDNKASCPVLIRIDDNFDVCVVKDCFYSLSGKILSIKGENIDKVEILVKNNHPEFPIVAHSRNDGYHFDLPFNGDYSIELFKEENFDNGLSALDVILLRRHILGIETFSEAYQFIAGDVNLDGQLTVRDIVELQDLILGNQDELSTNKSWRFIDADHTFENPEDALLVSDQLLLDINNHFRKDFIGIKVGDVNGSAIPND